MRKAFEFIWNVTMLMVTVGVIVAPFTSLVSFAEGTSVLTSLGIGFVTIVICAAIGAWVSGIVVMMDAAFTW